MNLTFKSDKMYLLQAAFNELLPDSLVMTQYELAENTEFSAADWTEFLTDGTVQKAIEAENSIIAKANMRKLISGAADNDRSVGAAQMINAMAKVDDGDKAEDHFYIYSYVPLTPNEVHADHIRQEDNWTPPDVIQEETQTQEEKQLEQFCDTEVTVREVSPEKAEVTEDEWF